MKKVVLFSVAMALLSFSSIVQANITIETVAIGDAGNAADTTGYGSVGYNYNIGKYEVTAGQYTAFLNAKANVSDTYGLYKASNIHMHRTGSAGSYSYRVDSEYTNHPIGGVTYWDACRFTNWLSNGQGNGSTETGAYTLNGYNGQDGRNISRNAGATWAVTSEDEWYKAAYYKNGAYSLYANGTSVSPIAGIDSNYSNAIGDTWDGTINGALEQNGTKDMMGNVMEWNEAVVQQSTNFSTRCLRGGPYNMNYDNYTIISSFQAAQNPNYEWYNQGFRVSQVPEPSSIITLLGGLAGLIGLRRRKA